VDGDTYYIDKKSIKADLVNLDITVLMGPVFILHLAKNRVFCLHASAFIINQTCFILMADSGTGKSTIARYIQQMNIGQRVADDIVPIKINNEKIRLLPNFPQLKLTQEQQYKGEEICQNTVMIFAQKSKSKTSLNRINTFNSIKKLIKHSVATKLFSAKELHNHLLFCHKASEQTKSYQLDYQHSKNSLHELGDLLNEMA
jgi:ABC-type oligopeptide transport system ATPase subunit